MEESTPFMSLNEQNIQIDIHHVTQIKLSSSSQTSLSSNKSLMCRICHCEEVQEQYLISPCYCTGTLKYVHQACLQQWLKLNGTKSCELCKFDFIIKKDVRPFREWKKLNMNEIEKRRLLCSIAFHLIALTCVTWSLYVLVDRTVDDIKEGKLDWPFWTKLGVVAIGFTGGVVFMYIQCKMYLQLCLKLRQYNNVITIQPITDDILKKSKAKYRSKCLNKTKSSNNTNNASANANNNASSPDNSYNLSLDDDQNSNFVKIQINTV
jgi:E3 ubiquitin-protein ligase MARCH1/8